MLRRAPSLAFCALMAAALGAGLAELVVATSLTVATGAGAYAWLGSRRAARAARTARTARTARA